MADAQSAYLNHPPRELREVAPELVEPREWSRAQYDHDLALENFKAALAESRYRMDNP